MKGVLRLPTSLRSTLKKPIGELYRGDGVEVIHDLSDELGCSGKVITVGDMTTYYALEAGVTPDIAIIDHKTKREKIPSDVSDTISKVDPGRVSVENPASTITGDLVQAIKKALVDEEDITLIFVHGEEDLAALPVVMLAPPESAVIYGQPGEGAVLIRVTEEKKREIANLLREMKYEGSNHHIDLILEEE